MNKCCCSDQTDIEVSIKNVAVAAVNIPTAVAYDVVINDYSDSEEEGEEEHDNDDDDDEDHRDHNNTDHE